MTSLSSDIQEIINSQDPGVTELRKYPKETLIAAVRELKKSYSSEAVVLKSKELDLALIQGKIELAKMEKFGDLADRILNKSSEFIEHPYGPSGYGNMVQGISGILSTINSGTRQPSQAEEEGKDEGLECRIKVATNQGMKWNAQNVRPERRSTILKKLEKWELSLQEGRDADVDTVLGEDYGDLLRSSGGCEAYVVGICETMEKYLGIGPSSKYLKTRFKRNVERYMKVRGLKSVPALAEEPAPVIDLDSIGNSLVREFLGDEIEPAHLRRRVEIFKKHVEAVNLRWSEVSAPDMLRKMVDGYKPVVITYDKSPDNPSLAEVFQGVVIHKLYNDQLQEFWDGFCKKKGLE